MAAVQDGDSRGRPLHLVFTGDDLDLAGARRSLRDWASSWSNVPLDLRADLELVLTELLTNAREAASNPDSPVELSVTVIDNELEVTVRSVGVLFEPPRARPIPTDVRGRGLAIIRSLSDDLVVRDDGGGSVAVSARFILDKTE